jgi:hypothetical protein
MASTRNKNTPGNYSAEQESLLQQRQYNVFENYRFPVETHLPGNGLLPARLPLQLDKQNADIESELLGIGSTNLVNPRMGSMLPPANRQIQSLNIIQKKQILLPDPLVISMDQRFQA